MLSLLLIALWLEAGTADSVAKVSAFQDSTSMMLDESDSLNSAEVLDYESESDSLYNIAWQDSVNRNDSMAIVARDTLPVVVRLPEKARWDSIRALSLFTYNDAPIQADPLEDLKAWFRRLLRGLLSTNEADIAWNIISYGLLLFAIVYIALKLTDTNLRSIFYGEKKSALSFERLEENPNSLPLSELIADAVARRAYRQAVRYLYLQSLKELSAGNLILWRIDKTNSDYISELRAHPLQHPFAEVTRLFEYIWYGDFPLDESKFLQTKKRFDAFTQSMKP
jgi:hypothetical protein